MKRLLCIFICLLSFPLFASVQVNPGDPNTLEPINVIEVMVGSSIPLVVYSDSNDFWSGGLFISGNDRAVGQLQARDKDPNTRDWSGSHLPAAGQGAYVLEWKDSVRWGFDMYPDDGPYPDDGLYLYNGMSSYDYASGCQEGNWFVIDYYALDEGQCNIGIYNHKDEDWTVPDPNVSLFFLNTPTRDLDDDGFINFADFAIFSPYWQAENCSNPNNYCHQADFSRNGSVGLEDVIMFADFWLYGTPGWKPPQAASGTDPNTTDPNIVFDVTYSIVDFNSLSEITLKAGESIRLYITKSSTYETVQIFDMDVAISDPNLGWIDRTPDDPNTTDIEGTVEILATPRMEFFDYYGPSYNDPNNLELFAASISAPMEDGDMASFVYTAAQTGDVILNLINYYDEVPAELNSITIHQVENIEALVEELEQIYDESPELQEQIPESEWNEFIESVEESQ